MAVVSQQLDELLAQGDALIEARRNPAQGRKKFPDFGEAYDAWNAAGKALVAESSGQAGAARWNAGGCRAMHALDQDADLCLKEQERQQAMLVELRRRLASSPPAAAPAAPVPSKKTQTCDLANELLLKDLRRVAKALGKKTVTVSDYKLKGRSTKGIVCNRFHGWNNALAAAHLDVSKRFKVSALELFENLDRVRKALGRLPYKSEIVKPRSAFSATPYRRRFGSWQRTLKAFAAWRRRGTLPKEAGEECSSPRSPNSRLTYLVFKRDSFKCTVCGKSPVTHPGTELQVDHIKPWSRGGLTTLANLTTLCRMCNLGKGAL